MIGLPQAPSREIGPLAQARFRARTRLRWAALAVEEAHLATVTDAPAAATPVWAAALAAVDACARVAADLRAGAPCATAVATTRDGRVYACGHAASVHVDGLRLGCANTAAFEPDCVAPRGPPR